MNEVLQLHYPLAVKLARRVKRITAPILGFKSFWSARILVAVFETLHMINSGELNFPVSATRSAADQFYSLAV
jgi:putative transposase